MGSVGGNILAAIFGPFIKGLFEKVPGGIGTGYPGIGPVLEG